MSNLERARSLFLSALEAFERTDYAEAARKLGEAHTLAPERASILVNLAAAQLKLDRADEAARCLRNALDLDPGNADAWQNMGLCHAAASRHAEAVGCYDKAISIDMQNAAAWLNRGVSLGKLGRHEEAVRCAEQVLSLAPDSVDAWINRSSELRALSHLQEALACAEQACALHPASAAACVVRGNVLHDLHRNEAALESFICASELDPLAVDAWIGRAAVLKDAGDLDASIACCVQAVSLQPDNALAWHNKGLLHYARKDMGAALASLDRAFALDPKLPNLAGIRLHIKLHGCDWAGYAQDCQALCDAIARGEAASDPFCFLALPADAALQRRCAATYASRVAPTRDATPPAGTRRAHPRLRIGYFSADLHEHATAYLMARLFECHDRDRFEIYAFSFGPDKADPMRARLLRAFDHFIDVRALSDADIAAKAIALEIDIAVDLKGFTQDARPGIFTHRPAPIQVSYLGYPGSLGMPCMDYIVADPVVIPAGDEAHYTEKVVRLPHCYQVNDAQRVIAADTPTRGALGLPETGFVFCCFNNSYKISPDVFDIWMRLLVATPGSVLWLLHDNEVATSALRHEARARGVDATRLVFAPRCELAAHLARHRQANLFLDTFHYNAHTTASDALWAGLPVVTRLGWSFPSRVAASLLSAVGLPDMITRSSAEYEALALKLAQEPALLEDVRQRLAHHRTQAPLFDSALFARHIEDAYLTMYARWQAGQSPVHFDVAA